MLTTSTVCGFKVCSYQIPHVETISLGIWANVGSRHEYSKLSGISHFVEHMVFKGTQNRSTIEIAKAIENVGGYMNAYTTRELTAYYAKVIKKDVVLAFDIISDMLLNPRFDKEELEKERKVILQEIAQTYDNPSDVIFDYYQSQCFAKQQLGSPVLGTNETVNSITTQDLFAHIARYYSNKDNIIFSAAGNIDHRTLEDLVRTHFSNIENKLIIEENTETTSYVGGEFTEKRGLEQAHVVLGFAGEKSTSPDYYNMIAYSNILGGGMSSKLFQHIREKNGLAYSIYSFPSFYMDCGTVGVYAGTTHKAKDWIVDLILAEMKQFQISDEELDKAKNQMSASVLMSLESTSSMADSMACDIIKHGHVRTTEESIAEINKITKESVMNVAQKVLNSKMTHVVIW